VDLLFVLDNSASMAEEQAKLVQHLDALLDPLAAAGTSVRLGVTTTDSGNPWCSGTTPEVGALRATSCLTRLGDLIIPGTMGPIDGQYACTDFCTYDDLQLLPTPTQVDPEPRVRPWLEPGNLPVGMSLRDAARCIVPQGITGCGFESPLESLYRAVSRAVTPGEASFGFVRSDSVLAVVFLTDEEDCSYGNDEIFLPEGPRVFWEDPTAEYPTSAVCWNAGVDCTGPNTGYLECHAANKDLAGAPADDEGAVLRPIFRYVQLLRDRGQHVIVGGLVGVPEGYALGQDPVFRDSEDANFQLNFGIGSVCSAPAVNGVPQTAVPAVRLMALQDQLHERAFGSICETDYRAPLDALARRILARIQGP
jgi:hypothetical protein